MRAAVFHTDTRKLSVEAVPDPTPGEGQVVIKVHRCGICGSDLHMAEGHVQSFEDGAIPGHELAGEVVALGKGAQGVAVGDRVAVLPYLTCGECVACRIGDGMGCANFSFFGSGPGGGYAEYALTNPGWCVQLPKSLGFDWMRRRGRRISNGGPERFSARPLSGIHKPKQGAISWAAL